MALAEFRSIYLPYCIEKQDDGSWIFLNREYSPVGFNAEHVQPAEYPVSVRLKGLGPKVLAELAFDGKADEPRIYLYNDGCIPTSSPEHMDQYLKRIAILARLKVA